MAANNRDSIKVVCRIRPENAIETKGSYRRCVTHDDTKIEVNCNPESKVSDMSGNHKFTFDRIFGPDSKQHALFDEVAIPIVDGVLNGYNGTIFAYGQTGSGKSFTMEGIFNDPELAGVIPRMFNYLFEKISAADSDIEFSIKCSYMEIYMERILCLLDAKK
jgi:kinesin family protein 5